MYVDPLEEEGLFLLDQEKRESEPQGEPPTERDLPFEFDPRVDYFQKFDALVTPWQLRPYETEKDGGLGSTALFSKRGAPEVKAGRRKTSTVSLRKYVRAIDPAGNVCGLTVSTVPPSPEFSQGDDRLGTVSRVIAEKSKRGWICVENEATCWSPYSGRRGNEYAAWAWAVMEHRVKKHTEKELADRPLHQTNVERQQRAQTDAIRQMGDQMVRAVADMVQGASPAATRSRRDKTE